jgi:hypothetical protein
VVARAHTHHGRQEHGNALALGLQRDFQSLRVLIQHADALALNIDARGNGLGLLGGADQEAG